MIVIAIIAIVISFTSLNFTDMKGKADTERQVRELQSDITTARMNALLNKKRGALLLGPNQYIYKTYSSDNEAVTAGSTMSNVNYHFELKRYAGSGTLTTLNIAVDRIEFDSGGFTNNISTYVLTPVTYGGGLNCIVVQKIRTSIGRMVDASTCQIQ